MKIQTRRTKLFVFGLHLLDMTLVSAMTMSWCSFLGSAMFFIFCSWHVFVAGLILYFLLLYSFAFWFSPFAFLCIFAPSLLFCFCFSASLLCFDFLRFELFWSPLLMFVFLSLSAPFDIWALHWGSETLERSKQLGRTSGHPIATSRLPGLRWWVALCRLRQDISGGCFRVTDAEQRKFFFEIQQLNNVESSESSRCGKTVLWQFTGHTLSEIAGRDFKAHTSRVCAGQDLLRTPRLVSILFRMPFAAGSF